MRDPRSVAREIPGISELLFPGLTIGVVSRINRGIRTCDDVDEITLEKVYSSNLDRAMMFEIAVVRGEQILEGKANLDWEKCLALAAARQKRHFDANIPESLTDEDMAVADNVAQNLVRMLDEIRRSSPMEKLVQSPLIAGYQWISSAEGDLAVGNQLIEVKCTGRKFGIADYRQILMYWLLSFASAVESGSDEWTSCVLLNPRLNHVVEVYFRDILGVITAGRTIIETLELFSSVVGDYCLRAASDIG